MSELVCNTCKKPLSPSVGSKEFFVCQSCGSIFGNGKTAQKKASGENIQNKITENQQESNNALFLETAKSQKIKAQENWQLEQDEKLKIGRVLFRQAQENNKDKSEKDEKNPSHSARGHR